MIIHGFSDVVNQFIDIHSLSGPHRMYPYVGLLQALQVTPNDLVRIWERHGVTVQLEPSGKPNKEVPETESSRDI